jgi:hypothetical protein
MVALASVRSKLLQTFGVAPSSENPFIRITAYPPPLCGRHSTNEALPVGEFQQFLTGMSVCLEPEVYRACFRAHAHIFTPTIMQQIAATYWSSGAAELCSQLVEACFQPGDLAIVMGAGLRAHPFPTDPALTTKFYDINPLTPDIILVEDNSSPLAGTALGSAAFICAPDTYGRVSDMPAIVRRDVATAKPGASSVEHTGDGYRYRYRYRYR